MWLCVGEVGRFTWGWMVSRLLIAANFFPLWLLVFCGAALVWPVGFTWFSGPWITWALAFIMLGMGVTLDAGAFRAVGRMPAAVGIGFVAQFTIMPAAGWAIATWMRLPADLAVGLILVACCPGGTASNVVAFIARANVALSVVMTFCSTVAAVLVTPLLTHWLAGAWLPVDGRGMVVTALQVVVAPVVLGVVLHHRFPRLAGPAGSVGPLVSVVLISMICASIIGHNRVAILEHGPVLLAAVLLLHGTGFLLGWVAARVCRLGPPEAEAVSIEVGMQNSGLAAVLARTHFAASPLTAVPAALSSVIHSLIGSALAVYWRTRRNADAGGRPGN
jgi:BASS family bile acid:Na+ symporter